MKEFDFQIRYGAAIKDARQRRELTQQELANKLGISKQAVSSWELDRTSPNIEMRRAIIKALCLPDDYFKEYMSSAQYAMTRIEELMRCLDNNGIDRVIAYGNYLKARNQS